MPERRDRRKSAIPSHGLPLHAAPSNDASVRSDADDGDELRFCSTCAFGSVCMPHGVDKTALRELHVLVEHIGPYRAGDPIFRTGDRFGAIYAVRGGIVKTR